MRVVDLSVGVFRVQRRHVERFTTIIAKIELLKLEFPPDDELRCVLEAAKNMMVKCEERARERAYGSG